MIISLDIETYGAFEKCMPNGSANQQQTVYNPSLSIAVDGVSRLSCRLVQQVAITNVNGNPSDPCTWEPGKTMVFDPCNTDHLAMITKHLADARVLVGSNIAFDIMYLRKFPSFRANLDRTKILVDTIILSWIHSGPRKERSLKALGPALGAFSYERTIKDGKFQFPLSADAIQYNAEDTHNAVLAASTLARRIRDENGQQFSESHMKTHSERLWNVIDISTNGQHFRNDEITSDLSDIADFIQTNEEDLAKKGIILSGDGARESQSSFMSRCVEECERIMPDLMDSGLIEFTDKRRSIRNNAENRNVMQAILSQHMKGDEKRISLVSCLRMLGLDGEARSLESNYLKITSTHSVKGNERVPSNCYVEDGVIHCHPSWYAAPTDEGGVQSLRLSCRRPAAQTWSPDMRHMMTDRDGMRNIRHLDMAAFELRIAAALSGDTDMQEFAFQKDPYSALAGNRAAAKVALLVGINGGSPFKAWRTAMASTGEYLTLPEVKSLPVFSGRWTRFREWQESCLRIAQRGQLRIPDAGIALSWNPDKTLHDAVSFMIQGTAALFMSRLQGVMSREVPEAEVVLQTHDELSVCWRAEDSLLDQAMVMAINQIACDMFPNLTGRFTYRMHGGYDPANAKGVPHPC